MAFYEEYLTYKNAIQNISFNNNYRIYQIAEN